VIAGNGKHGRRKAVALPPDLSKEGQLGQRRLFHNNIIWILFYAFLWFITIELKQIFHSLLCYFWGQHCGWTVANIFGKDFFVFHPFPLPSSFLLTPSSIDVPASLVLHSTWLAVLPLGSVAITSDCCLFQHQITSDFYIAV